MLKKDKLRYNEYYDMQSVYDELYQQSRNNNNFYKLIEIIGSKQNIRLAYKNLRGNSGSHTIRVDFGFSMGSCKTNRCISLKGGCRPC